MGYFPGYPCIPDCPLWMRTTPTPEHPAISLWTGTLAGWYYVHPQHVAATDSANPNGYPNKPRLTIPDPIPAGAVVVVVGTYTHNHGIVYTQLNSSGVNGNPCFVTRSRDADPPVFGRTVRIGGSYLVLDGFKCYDWPALNGHSAAEGLGFGDSANNIVVRNGEVTGLEASGEIAGSCGGLSFGSYTAGQDHHDILIDHVRCHHNGTFDRYNADNIAIDRDHHGISVGRYAYNIWIKNCELDHNGGDGMQLNPGNNYDARNDMHHIYVFGCTAHENLQTGLWVKFLRHSVFAHNASYGHRCATFSTGAGYGYQYAPSDMWFVNNVDYDNLLGIDSGTDSGQGTPEGHDPCLVYVVGHVCRDTLVEPGSPPGQLPAYPDSNRGGTAIQCDSETGVVWIVNCTAVRVHTGVIQSKGGGPGIRVHNCLFSQLAYEDVWTEDGGENATNTIHHCRLDSDGGEIHWGGAATQSLAAFAGANPTRATGTTAGDPGFNSSGNDFTIAPSSPCRGAGDRAVLEALDVLYKATFGPDVTILYDVAGNARANPPSIGAYEFVEGKEPPSGGRRSRRRFRSDMHIAQSAKAT